MSSVRANHRAKWIVAIGVSFVALVAFRASSSDRLDRSGEQLFVQYCASCHGAGGRGDGPVAASLKVEVPDLTLLTRRHGGKFPEQDVLRIMDGRHVIGAHGNRSMPIWGESFAQAEAGNPDAERTTEVVLQRLTDHLRAQQR